MIGLSQRYISKKLTHFVGKNETLMDSQYEILKEILKSRWLVHPPIPPNSKIQGNLTIKPDAKISRNEMYSPQIVCFCDIPISELSIHVRKYSNFGLSFDKDFIVKKGGVPVFYIPKYGKVRFKEIENMTAEEKCKKLMEEGLDGIHSHIDQSENFDYMVSEYIKLFSEIKKFITDRNLLKRISELQRFFDFHIFNHLKFFNHNLADDDERNYYFEREWRLNGYLRFRDEDVKTIIIPKKYAARFRKDFPDYNGQLIFID
jgi:Putative abortive phage resistance protein AbiGi, antitoxin